MSTGKIVSRSTLQQVVRPHVKPYWEKQRAKYAGFFDTKFCLPDIDDIGTLYSNIDFPTFARDLFDCEDFAYLCKAEISRQVRNSNIYTAAWAFGLAWGRFQWVADGKEDHACNWFVDSLGRFWWLEPQKGTRHPPNACRGHLALLLV